MNFQGNWKDEKRSSVTPDKEAARAFLNALDPNATMWCFQTFDDNADRRDGNLADHNTGTLDHVWPWLCERSKRGAGVFVTINETDGKGRETHNIERVRAVFVDTDGADHEPILAHEPHIVVESSPGNFHDYWLVKDCPREEFKEAQKRMIVAWGTDKNVNDLPRVMRLPGFPHQKVDTRKGLDGTPFMVRMVENTAFFGPDHWSDRKAKIYALGAQPRQLTLSEQAMQNLEINVSDFPSGKKSVQDYQDLFTGMKTDGQKHMSVRDTAASMAAQECKKDFVEAFIRQNTTVYDRNTQNLIDSAFVKFAPAQGGAQPGAAFSFIPVGDLQYRAPEYIVEELIETETLGLIFGDPGCGKSFLAVDLALSVASGTRFHGRDTKQGAVFFIAGEGHNGLARRFAAWSHARDVSLSGVPLFKSERAAQFLDAASAQAVADAVAGLAEQNGSPALIIIDTLARNFGGGNENDTKDMGEFVAAVDDLKARFPGCAVLIVHHSGHADKQRARGAMALKGALDTEYRVEKDGSMMRLVNTKMKDAEQPQDVYFQFDQVDLGDATSAVLRATEAPERQHKLTPAQRLAMQTFTEAAREHGRWGDEMFVGLHRDDWRPFFFAGHTADNDEAKRKAFDRARAALVDMGRLMVEDDVYRTTDIAVNAAIGLGTSRPDTADMSGHSAICPSAEAEKSGRTRTHP